MHRVDVAERRPFPPSATLAVSADGGAYRPPRHVAAASARLGSARGSRYWRGLGPGLRGLPVFDPTRARGAPRAEPTLIEPRVGGPVSKDYVPATRADRPPHPRPPVPIPRPRAARPPTGPVPARV